MHPSKIRLFIVAGRTGHSLIVCKALPFAVLSEIKEIIIFSEAPGFTIPKSRYITIPAWIKKLKPSFIVKLIRITFEPLQLIYFTLRLKPDIINGIYTLPKGLNSLIAARLTGTQCLISVIGSRLEIETELPFRKFWERINIWQLHKCDAITIKGEADRDYLISKKINPGKLFTLNGAIDTDKFTFSSGKRPIDLLFVGTFIELKGPDRILKIIKKLLSCFRDLRAVMVGDGVMLKETMEMANELSINQNVVFEGYQRNTVPYFQQAKILVLPSRSESLPTTMLEAMVCGCVPVISNVGNVKEAALHDINSKVIDDYTDINCFVENIAELLNDEPKRQEFAKAARLMVINKYSVLAQSVIAKNIINYLENK